MIISSDTGLILRARNFGVSKMCKREDGGYALCKSGSEGLFIKQICLRFLVQVWETIYWEIIIKAGVGYICFTYFLGGRLRNFRRSY